MMLTPFIAACLSLLVPAQPTAQNARAIYRCVLNSPGGELPFELRLSDPRQIHPRAWIINGGETIDVTSLSRSGNKLLIDFPHYTSRIEADWDETAGRMKGVWTKSSGTKPPVTMEFRAEMGAARRFKPHLKITEDISNAPRIDGRWAVKFSKSEDPAIGLFVEKPDRLVEGTFLTPTGDYRFLAGSYEHGLLRLSCFDGSHAFLFAAVAQPDGSLKGDFWSGSNWHETWTAQKNENVVLHDGFELVSTKGPVRFAELKFTTLDGLQTNLEDIVFGAKAIVLEVFGSWCPNCHDAADLLSELDRDFKSRGLHVVALAFERGESIEKNIAQIRRFIDRRKTKYPILVAGHADKEAVPLSLPFLDSFKAFPTFVFIRADGSIAAVYTGFSGPATGKEYSALRQRFREQVELLLR